MPGGRAGSEKSTVAGSKPTNRTRFINPPRMPSLQRSSHVLAAANSLAFQRIAYCHTTHIEAPGCMVGHFHEKAGPCQAFFGVAPFVQPTADQREAYLTFSLFLS